MNLQRALIVLIPSAICAAGFGLGVYIKTITIYPVFTDDLLLFFMNATVPGIALLSAFALARKDTIHRNITNGIFLLMIGAMNMMLVVGMAYPDVPPLVLVSGAVAFASLLLSILSFNAANKLINAS